MNWVDIFIILFLIFFTFEGLGRSFIGETLDFLSFLIAFILALKFYYLGRDFLVNAFLLPHSMASVLGFLAIWFISESILFIVVHLLIFKNEKLKNLNKHLSKLSTIPAFLRGLVFISILLVLVGTFPLQPSIKKSVQNSKLGFFILSQSQNFETPLKNIFGGISQDTLTFLTIKPKSDQTINLGFQTNNFQPSGTLENKMILLVNQERISRGIKPLKYSGDLRDIARSHSEDMFRRGYFSHYSPEGKTVADRGENNGISYFIIGENLAYAPDLNQAHNGLMNSPGHRENILSTDFGKIGIGIMDGGVYGLMVTQVFSN